MRYPTKEEVEAAGQTQLAKWYRFLPSPGFGTAGKAAHDAVYEKEKKLMALVCKRFNALGGMTIAISKAIGWDND